MPINQPTPRQIQLLKAIARFQDSHCYSPTIAELAIQLNVTRSTTFEHIAELQKKLLLTTTPGKARSLKLTSRSRKLLKKLTATNEKVIIEADTHQIPLVGKVAAGSPIEAIEDNQTLSLANKFSPDHNTFALQVKGDSMIEDGIFDGDYVICRKSSVANTGQLVIAMVDGDSATLKRFYKEKDRVRLVPANRSYKPIYSKNAKVHAVVVGLLRKF